MCLSNSEVAVLLQNQQEEQQVKQQQIQSSQDPSNPTVVAPVEMSGYAQHLYLTLFLLIF